MKKRITRREFLKQGCAAILLAPALSKIINKTLYASLNYEYPREAMYYEKIDDSTVNCNLCPNQCILKNRQRSKCFVREVRKGNFYSLVYGYPGIIFIEPVEKFPLNHFKPQTNFFSIGTAGCNLHCKYCQNWQLALNSPENTKKYNLLPKDVMSKAKSLNCKGIAYFYTEPVVFYEYVYDTAYKAKEEKFFNVVTTAGYINPNPLKNLAKYIDAFAVTLKGFDEKFYEDIIGGKLKYVLDTLIIIKKENRWLEIINLIVPTLNDDLNKIKQMCKWIYSNLGKEVPLHFSRFYPAYKLLNLPPTPQSILEEAQKVAFETGLKYVYINNLPGHIGNNTYCPNCKKMLIARVGFKVIENFISDGKCKYCGTKIDGIW